MKDKHDDSLPRRWIKCALEEEYIGENRKEGKRERKTAQANDRSKYKKTDREKYLKNLDRDQEARLNKEEELEGRVLSITPRGIIVEQQGQEILCILRGLLKKEKTLSKNLVAVGDIVLFEKTADREGVIGHIRPRRTLLSRADNLSRRKEQLIAANIDQVIITTSVVHPPLKPAVIDRYIIAARKGGMEPLIVLNKMDLLDQMGKDHSPSIERERLFYEEAIQAYAEAGISLISVSAATGRGMEELKEAMRDKASVFSGQSGVGKSSLINAMAGSRLRVGEIVEKTNKGSHTTTMASLIPLEFGGWCVDTPGIKSFGVWDLDREEVEGYFQEIHALGPGCKFADCTHAHEEQCAVLKALEEGLLSPIRYTSYQALRESAGEEHVRR